MEKEEYGIIYELGDSHWWYRGLRELLTASIARLTANTPRAKILDAGCGPGKMRKSYAALRSFGMDFSAEALRFVSLQGGRNVARASVTNVPFRSESFDLVLSSDVLCHRSIPDDVEALREFGRVLKPNGKLVLNLPAFAFLYSEHDRYVHTQRRYRANEVNEKLKQAGLIPEKVTYWNSVLFPVAALIRFLRKPMAKKTESKSDLRQTSGLVNQILLRLLRLENRWILGGGRFPFGLSVFCIARKE